jgi:hypothetical protein
MLRRTISACATLAAAFCCLFAAAPLSAAPAPEMVMWTPVKDALFQIDSKPVKLWSLYYVRKDKKEQRFLLQIGARYLMIDTQLRLITEFDPAAFTKKGNGYEMPREAKGVKALPSEDWILRDRGTAFVIHWKLKEEGRVLEIELPKMPDFRNVLW